MQQLTWKTTFRSPPDDFRILEITFWGSAARVLVEQIDIIFLRIWRILR